MFVHAVKRLTPVVLLAMALSACATADPAADETDATTGASGVTSATGSSAATSSTSSSAATSTTGSSAATSTTGSSAATSTTGTSAVTSTTGSSAATSTTGTSAATSTTGASSTTSTEVEAETFEVNIENFRFVPASITVRVGDTVRWKLESGTHTTTSSTGVWDSDSMTAGDRFPYTFNQPGTYAYFCEIHPGMQGSVVVQG